MLVDRLWPRGVSKNAARLDEWNRDIAPSPVLRKWFDHKPERFEKFSALYTEELSHRREQLERLHDIAAFQTLTLLYGARDAAINHAAVLCGVLKKLKR